MAALDRRIIGDDDIVVSGLSGRFPKSANIDEFYSNLLNGIDMLSVPGQRYPPGLRGYQKWIGLLENLDEFDAEFFNISPEEANTMDPQLRILLEVTYEAIVDSGLTLKELRGSKTGYFHGFCTKDNGAALSEGPENLPKCINHFEGLISFIFDLRGPVMSFDTACSSGQSALTEAFWAIKSGLCERAIVSGFNISQRHDISLRFLDLAMLNRDGPCKSLDKSASGFARSEGVTSIILQRSSEARRAYMKIANSRTNLDGYKPEGITFPSADRQCKLLMEAYKQINLDPKKVKYIEGHLTGTQAGDFVETLSICKALCQDREDPLLVGCLKSNLGHTEAVAGIVATVKTALIFQTGQVPANLHFREPNPKIEGLFNGQIKPVNRNMKFNERYIAIDSFGFGGANAHTIVEQGARRSSKREFTFAKTIPRLVCLQGRNSDGVKYAQEYLGKHKKRITSSFLYLMDLFSMNVVLTMPRRGFTLITQNDEDITFEHHISPTDIGTNHRELDVLIQLDSILSTLAVTIDKGFKEIPFWRASLEKMDKYGENFGTVVSELVHNEKRQNNQKEDILKAVITRILLIELLQYIGIKIRVIPGDDSFGDLITRYITKSSNFEEIYQNAGIMAELHKNCYQDGSNENSVIMKTIPVMSIQIAETDISNKDRLSLPLATNEGYISVENFLRCLGQLYSLGVLFETDKLYPQIELPVPVDTLSLHSIIKWNHSKSRTFYSYPLFFNYVRSYPHMFTFDMKDPQSSFLWDHKIDGSILMPGVGYLMMAWTTVASCNHTVPSQLAVRFEEVKFHRATFLTDRPVTFTVRYIPTVGKFVLKEGGSEVCTGSVFPLDKASVAQAVSPWALEVDSSVTSDGLTLDSKDIYKELRVRGYDYGPTFKSLVLANEYGKTGQVVWKSPVNSYKLADEHSTKDPDFFKTWITFSDAVLQLSLLANRETRDLVIPVSIGSVICDPGAMLNKIKGYHLADVMDEEDSSKLPIFDAFFDFDTNTIGTEGVYFSDMMLAKKSRKGQQVQLEKYRFIPYQESFEMGRSEATKIKEYKETIDRVEQAIRDLKRNGHQNVLKQEDIERIEHKYPNNLEQYTVLAELLTALKGSETNESSMMHKHDLLVGNHLSPSTWERFLKPFINTICNENPRRKHLAILERNDGHFPFCNKVIKILDSVSINAANYTLLQTSDNIDDKDALPSDVVHCLKSIANPIPELRAGQKYDLLVYRITSLEQFKQEMVGLSEYLHGNGIVLALFETDETGENIELPMRTTNFDLLESQVIIDEMNRIGWTLVARRTLAKPSSSWAGLMFKKKYPPVAVDHVIQVTSFDYSWLPDLQRLLKLGNDSRIWLVSNEKDFQGLPGLWRCLAQEPLGDRVHCIGNRTGSGDRSLDLSSIDFSIMPFREISERNLKMNFYDPDKGWGDYCPLTLDEDAEQEARKFQMTSEAYLRVGVPGDLTSLTWTQLGRGDDSKPIGVYVHYAALNFRDIMLATGRLAQIGGVSSMKNLISASIGSDFAGLDTKGNRLMGCLPDKAIATKVFHPNMNFCWNIPEEWSMEEAATVPLVYCTVVYALLMRGNLRKGESILIHAGTGGVGLAAINICLAMKCKLYATVGTKRKREFLRKTFPIIKDEDIFNSRDTSFEDDLMRATNGRGVDIVLNSLSEDKLLASLRCLAPGGRFLEIGKYDMMQNTKFNLGLLDEGRSFHGICLDQVRIASDEQSDETGFKEAETLGKLMAEMIKKRIIKPLPRIIFQRDRVEEAFRFMSNGKHIGKVLIKIVEEDENGNPITPQVRTLNTVRFSHEKCYIIVGGFGGIGLELAQWMAEKGARHIVLNSRRGPTSSYHHYAVSKMEEKGVTVVVSKEDLSNFGGVQKLIQSISMPVGGFFNSALVLRDALFMDQTIDNFEKVCSPKISITDNFDKVTRKMCPHLDFFVVFSSVACGRGNPGQANYGLANSFMEAICEKRRQDGLHGLAIELGAVGDVGYVEENWGSQVKIRDTIPQRINSVLNTLEQILPTSESVVSSQTPVETSRAEKSSSDALIQDIIHIFQIKDIESMDPNITLTGLGMDSLMGIEIQQAIERRFNITLTNKEIQNLTISDVRKFDESSNSEEHSISRANDGKNLMDIGKIIKLETDPIFIIKDEASSEMSTLLCPPIDNDWKDLKALANNLPGKVFGINWITDLINYQSIEEIASFFVHKICQTIKSDIFIATYSFGTIVGIHIATALKKLEGGPKVKGLIHFDGDVSMLTYAKSFNLDDNEFSLIELFLTQILPKVSQGALALIRKASKREDKLDQTKRLLLMSGFTSNQSDQITDWISLNCLFHKCLMKFDSGPVLSIPSLHLKSTEVSIIYTNSLENKHKDHHYFEGNHHNFIGLNMDRISALTKEFILANWIE